MSGVKKHRYICASCGKSAMLADTPGFCPYCGDSNLRQCNDKARKHAEDMIEELNALVPVVDKAWNAYATAYINYEVKRRVLYNYALNGVIDKSLIPTLGKRNLMAEFNEYRKGKRGAD